MTTPTPAYALLPNRRLDRSEALFCRRWGVTGHNEITVRGTVLFWRRYAVCCACGNERRTR